MQSGSFETVTRAVSPKSIVPTAWITALLLHDRPGVVDMAAGTSVAAGIAEILKLAIDRRRPWPLGSTPWRSFPSGHSAASTAYFMGTALLAPREHRALALGAACLAAAAVNALRVRARQHWLGDVIAGDAIAVAVILGARLGRRGIRRRGPRRPDLDR